MSQKFVMLFLVSSPRVVSLDVAAKILIGEDHGAERDKNKFKSEFWSGSLRPVSPPPPLRLGGSTFATWLFSPAAKVRRLYDIANVLRSLKLIEKVHVTEERGRKPAFEWVGPEDFPPVAGTGFWFLFPCAVSPACLFYVSLCFVLVADLKGSTSGSPARTEAVLEPRSNKDNCTKKLFSSPGTKRSFTRHPSLIKLAKTIQDDRRKINSAPSSPARSSLGAFLQRRTAVCPSPVLTSPFLFSGETPSADFPSKMARLAAICKIELDQEEA